MALTDADKVDRLFKGSQGREMTSTDKAYYEETAGDLDIQLGEEIWIDDIDSDPATAVSEGTAWMQSGWLIEDNTVASQKAWFASGSGIGYWRRWIPPKCGQGYTINIYESGSGGPGDKLSDADMGTLGAVFDYQAGIFWMNTSPSAYTYPFYISGYRYSGNLAKKSTFDSLYQESGTAGTDVAWSGASGYVGHSGNKDIHYPSSNLVTWLNYEYLNKENSSAFTPDADYEPATKKYVDDSIEAAGGYTDEQAQDAVGENVTSGLSYNDDAGAIYITKYDTLSSQARQGYLSGQKVKDIFDSTVYSLSSNLYNKSWIDSFSGSIDTRLDSLEDQDVTSWSGSSKYWAHSSNKDIHFPSSNLREWFDNLYSPSGIKYGWATITDDDTIPHNLGTIPRFVSVVPSSNLIHFGVSAKADDTNIYVRITANGSWNVKWTVEV